VANCAARSTWSLQAEPSRSSRLKVKTLGVTSTAGQLLLAGCWLGACSCWGSAVLLSPGRAVPGSALALAASASLSCCCRLGATGAALMGVLAGRCTAAARP
jgi:hypothetical protein